MLHRWSFAGLSLYLALMAASAVLGLAKNLVFAKALGASSFGYYGIVDLVVTYGAYAGSLGLLEALNRQLPYLRGAGHWALAERLGRAGTAALLLISTAAALLFVSFVQLFVVGDSQLRTALILGTFLSFINVFFLYVVLQLLAAHRPVAQALVLLAKSAVVLVIGGTLVGRYGLGGVIVGEAIGVALATVGAAIVGRALPRPEPSALGDLRPMFRLGVPMLLGVVVTSLGRNVDRIVVVASLGVLVFAQYNFALILFAAASVGVNSIVLYATPRISFGAGAGVPLTHYVRVIDRVVVTVVSVGTVSFFPFAVLLPQLGSKLFGDYALGLNLMILVYAAAVLQTFTIYQSILVAAGAASVLFQQALVVTVLATAGSILAATTHQPAATFVAVFVGARLAAAALLTVTAHRVARGELRFVVERDSVSSPL